MKCRSFVIHAGSTSFIRFSCVHRSSRSLEGPGKAHATLKARLAPLADVPSYTSQLRSPRLCGSPPPCLVWHQAAYLELVRIRGMPLFNENKASRVLAEGADRGAEAMSFYLNVKVKKFNEARCPCSPKEPQVL